MADQTQTQSTAQVQTGAQKAAPAAQKIDAQQTTQPQPAAAGALQAAAQEAAAQAQTATDTQQQPAQPAAPTQADVAALAARIAVLETGAGRLADALQAALNTGTGNASLLGTLKSSLETIGEVQVQQKTEVEELQKESEAHGEAIQDVQTRRFPKPLEDRELKEYLLRYGVG